jgi:hypothetical protein
MIYDVLVLRALFATCCLGAATARKISRLRPLEILPAVAENVTSTNNPQFIDVRITLLARSTDR